MWLAIVPVRIDAAATGGTFLDRDPAQVRVATFNVNWDSIYSRVNAARAAGFARLAAAVAPDIWAFQELDTTTLGQTASTAGELGVLLDLVQPVPGGWHVYKSGELAFASRWPLGFTRSNILPAGSKPVVAALVDLPNDIYPVDLYLLNSHHKCCSGLSNEVSRQSSSDAMVSWMRDARAPGGAVSLPYATPMVALGDFNIVGGTQPLTTILGGDIRDTARYGEDSPPDWDGTENGLVDARHNGLVEGDTYTWRNDTGGFAPSRLDFITYSDSVLAIGTSFVVNTVAMSDTELAAVGLERYDATYDGSRGVYDHLPLVVDFALRPSTSLALTIDVAAGTLTQAEAGFVAIPLAPQVTKTGVGRLVLDTTNRYTGPTLIRSGTLAIVDPAAIVASTLVDVSPSATFDVSRLSTSFGVSAGQTLAGSGAVVGSVVFGRGATLSPGSGSGVDGLALMSAGGGSGPMATMAAVPEPGGLTLAALAGLVVMVCVCGRRVAVSLRA